MGNFRFLVVVRLSFAREQYSELSSIAVCNPVVFEVFLENAEGNPGSCHIPATMATAVREEWNDRRPPERAAHESNRGGEASSAARKARSRPLTYKGGAPLLFRNCSTRAEWHRHIPCGRDRHRMPVGYGETRDAREVERLRDGRDRTFVICGDIEARFRPSLTHLLSPSFPNRSHGRRV